jgi:hypothetical protein
MIGRLLAPALLILASCAAGARAEPEKKTHYFYYLHGKVVEDLGPRGVNPRWGVYDYPGLSPPSRRRV